METGYPSLGNGVRNHGNTGACQSGPGHPSLGNVELAPRETGSLPSENRFSPLGQRGTCNFENRYPSLRKGGPSHGKIGPARGRGPPFRRGGLPVPRDGNPFVGLKGLRALVKWVPVPRKIGFPARKGLRFLRQVVPVTRQMGSRPLERGSLSVPREGSTRP